MAGGSVQPDYGNRAPHDGRDQDEGDQPDTHQPEVSQLLSPPVEPATPQNLRAVAHFQLPGVKQHQHPHYDQGQVDGDEEEDGPAVQLEDGVHYGDGPDQAQDRGDEDGELLRRREHC